MLKALDLFSGAGGASKGLQRAGFHVTGVDINPQPRYCGDVFHQADAMTFPLDGYDFVWASPVCKAYTTANAIHRRAHPTDQIAPLRERLQATGKHYCIENVIGAPLMNPFLLCGLMFGLRVLRHRIFETNWLISRPTHPRHNGSTNSHRGMSTGGEYVCVAGHNFLIAEAKAAMGIDWMVQSEISQAIPPAYAEFIGRHVAHNMVS